MPEADAEVAEPEEQKEQEPVGWHFTEKELLDACARTNANKAIGPDGITVTLLRHKRAKNLRT